MKYLFIFQYRYREDYFNNSDIEKLWKLSRLKYRYTKKKISWNIYLHFIIENLILISKIIVMI